MHFPVKMSLPGLLQRFRHLHLMLHSSLASKHGHELVPHDVSPDVRWQPQLEMGAKNYKNELISLIDLDIINIAI